VVKNKKNPKIALDKLHNILYIHNILLGETICVVSGVTVVLGRNHEE
jgi:hypothetical protein